MSRAVRKVPIPTEEELRQYRNVPVPKACAYLGVGGDTLRRAILQERVPFGFMACGKQNTVHISPEALINYYHNGINIKERIRNNEDQDDEDLC